MTWTSPQSWRCRWSTCARSVWCRYRRRLPATVRWRSCWPSTAAICWSSAGWRSTRWSMRMSRPRGCSSLAGRALDGLGLQRLSAADVSLFLVAECPKRSVSGARDLVCALRSFLRFLHVAGLIDAPLVWAVPSVADLRDRTLPRGLEPAAVRKMLASCDRRRTGWAPRLRGLAVALEAGAARRRGRRDSARGRRLARRRAARPRQGLPAGRAAFAGGHR